MSFEKSMVASRLCCVQSYVTAISTHDTNITLSRTGAESHINQNVRYSPCEYDLSACASHRNPQTPQSVTGVQSLKILRPSLQISFDIKKLCLVRVFTC